MLSALHSEDSSDKHQIWEQTQTLEFLSSCFINVYPRKY